MRFLSVIGGERLEKAVDNVWRKIIGARLAYTYTLTGKGKDKGRLRDLPHLMDTVYGK